MVKKIKLIKKKSKKPKKLTEKDIENKFRYFLKNNFKKYENLYTFNGKFSNGKSAGFAKNSGYLVGIPDFTLFKKKIYFDKNKKKRVYGGLFIEFKTKKGVVSSKQKVVMKSLKKSGYCVKVCSSFKKAALLFCKYVKK